MTEIVVREATAADSAGLAAVSASATATLRQTYRPTSKAIKQRQSADVSWAKLVALLDGQAVGCVEYRVEDDGVHFLSLGVHERYRRQGVARRLIGELEAIAKRFGLRRLSAYTVKEAGIVPIFERMGFAVVSERPSELFESDQFEQLTEVRIEKGID